MSMELRMEFRDRVWTHLQCRLPINKYTIAGKQWELPSDGTHENAQCAATAFSNSCTLTYTYAHYRKSFHSPLAARFLFSFSSSYALPCSSSFAYEYITTFFLLFPTPVWPSPSPLSFVTCDERAIIYRENASVSRVPLITRQFVSRRIALLPGDSQC